MREDFDKLLHNLNVRGIDAKDFYTMLEDHLVEVGELPPHHRLTKISAHGNLSVSRVNDDGSKWLMHSDHNLITKIGFAALVAMWGEPDSPDTFNDVKPNIISIGDQVAPTAPTTDDSDLQSRVDEGVIDQRIFISTAGVTNAVQFERTIEKNNSAANTAGAITEAGLHRADDAPAKLGLIARQTFTGIPKNDTFQLLFQWRFTFTET